MEDGVNGNLGVLAREGDSLEQDVVTAHQLVVEGHLVLGLELRKEHVPQNAARLIGTVTTSVMG